MVIIITRVTQPSQFDPNPYNYGCADSISLVLRRPVTVTTVADSGPGSLREAIPIGSYITFDKDVFSAAGAPHTITLTTALPVITGDTQIAAIGANVVTVQRSAAVGTPQFRIFIVRDSGLGKRRAQNVAIFQGLTMDNGNAPGDGGGIECLGNCQLTDCVLSGNKAFNGGGILSSDGNLFLERCTLSGNAAGQGAGIFLRSTNSSNRLAYEFSNCTFSDNGDQGTDATVSMLVANMVAVIKNCTFSGENPAINNAASGPINVDNNIFKTTASTTNFKINASNSGTTSNGFNLSNRDDSATLNASTDRNNTDPKLGPLQNNGGSTPTRALLAGSLAIDKGNTNLLLDQRGYPRPVDDPASPNVGTNNSDIGAFELQLPGPTPSPTPTPTPLPTRLAQISTRLKVGAGDNALFGGFIITGSQAKRLVIRAIGPTVPVAGNLQDPTLELYSGSTRIGFNDNWVDASNKQEIIDSGIAPKSGLESAILTSLSPGVYSAIVRGVNDGTGVGLVEVYDLDQAANSKLAQISTRGFVQTDDNAMFGGFFVSNGSQKVIIRAIGPSTGLIGALQDPTLELYDGNGVQLTNNDNWVDSPDKQAIIDSTVPPKNDFESAIVRTLAPGPYSAIVRGANSSVGIALVEVYALQ